ncbi:MAG TPA: DNA polymerase IV [Candidatus Paceibacterota bacterium]|nr:DNA polymerase IV [Candidatus Paceibacterota bacterium]
MNPYPRAILHFDGDAFFASIEQVLNHTLKGKPVVTGAERGAATSISYEAKARGVSRGMNMREIKLTCPEAVIVPGNYTAYSIYARRMYSIVRSFTPIVEEYSIDECFAEITGLDARFGMSYERIALLIKARLEEELGVTFGVGLAPNKTLAKVASKYRKPAGLTAIPREQIADYLGTLRAGSIWGLGGTSSLRLERLGITGALEYAQQTDAWLSENRFEKPLREIWAELNGHFVKPLSNTSNHRIGSIMKTHTFRPTREREVIYAELSKNVEAACVKARRHHVRAKALSFYLKTQEFTYYGRQLTLPVALDDPAELLRLIAAEFDEVYDPMVLYRASGITLRSLVIEEGMTRDLFGTQEAANTKSEKKLEAIDRLNRRYGRHTVFLASSLTAVQAREDSLKSRGTRHARMPIEARKKTIDIPFLGKVR